MACAPAPTPSPPVAVHSSSRRLAPFACGPPGRRWPRPCSVANPGVSAVRQPTAEHRFYWVRLALLLACNVAAVRHRLLLPNRARLKQIAGQYHARYEFLSITPRRRCNDTRHDAAWEESSPLASSSQPSEGSDSAAHN